MRHNFSLVLFVAAGLAGGARGEIIDRIAVSVGDRVITETDLYREIRITALLNNQKPDFSPASKRTTAERMVDQTLVRSELDASRYPPPAAADVDGALQEEKARYGSDVAYRRTLAEYGVTEEDLKARLAWQLMLVHFIDLRFRPGIQVSNEEILKYFNEHMREALAQQHPGETPAVGAYRTGIEKTLNGLAADQQVEQWLQEARRRTHIQYHDEVFQ